MTTDENARLELDDKSYELSITTGSEGERALNIGSLRQDTGVITPDPGFKNTGSCESAITYIDGENGILRYRGYPIEQLAEQSTFLEVAHLLIQGELPSEADSPFSSLNSRPDGALARIVRNAATFFGRSSRLGLWKITSTCDFTSSTFNTSVANWNSLCGPSMLSTEKQGTSTLFRPKLYSMRMRRCSPHKGAR